MTNPINRLLEMLEFRRPAFSVYEEAFIDRYIMPYKPSVDDFGNLIVDVGVKPNVLWSSHTDTVHRTSGLQSVFINKAAVIRAVPHKESNCLGADCTTGVWIMLEMLDHGIEGRYIFHRAEEIGGKGSKYIAKNTPGILKGIDAAIAFDRKGLTDVITHQGYRTASDEFAVSMAAVLGGGYKPSSHGMMTDTKSYSALVPECTNISVGYESAHSSGESQSIIHARWLRDQMIKFDTSTLVIKRTPEEPKTYSSGYGHGYHGGGYHGGGYQTRSTYKDPETLFDLVNQYPTSTSKIIEAMGFDFDMWNDLIIEAQAANNSGKPIKDVPFLFPPEERNKVVSIDKKKKAN